MKSLLCLFLVSVATTYLFAQNKTLGVGTASPNPNAALHVESPTNNQGILIPRLSTTQRAGLTPALAEGDVGLIVFDTDTRALAIWNGTGWDIGSKVGAPISIDNNLPTGNAATLVNSNAANTQPALEVNTSGSGNAIQTPGKIQAGQFFGDGSGLVNLPRATQIQFPLVDTLTNIPTTQSAIRLVNNNTATGSFGLINLTNLNANNNFSPLYIENRGLNGATDMVINNPTNTNDVIGANTNGLGRGGLFIVNNTANTSAALFGSTNGPGRAIHGTNTGAGNGFAGLFQNTNTANTFPAIQANTVGTGPGVRVLQNASSVGSGIDVVLQNAASTAIGFSVNQSGLGGAGNFSINNSSNASNGIQVNSNGTGVGASVSLTNPGNNNAAVFSTTQGTGAGVYGRNENPSTGFGGFFEVTNPTNTFQAVKASTSGTGGAARFETNNTSGTNPNIESVTNSPGGALRATSTGLGYGGWFEIDNPANASPVLSLTSNGTGNAITANRPIQATQFIGDGSLLTGVGGGLTLPFVGSTPSAGNTFDLTTTSASGNVARFVTNNASNNNATLSVSTDGGGGAGLFTKSSGGAINTLGATNSGNGSGGAGLFQITNAANSGTALSGSTTGTGSAAIFSVVNSAGLQPALSVTSTSDTPAAAGSAGKFEALGAGRGLTVEINNAANTSRAFSSTHAGLGSAGRFDITNPSNTSPAISINYAGTGNAITANAPIQATSFIGNGSALTGVTATPGANSVGTAEVIDASLTNADINAAAAIADTKLATIATAGKVANTATTATSANTVNSIVARDASGNFSAGAITATSFTGSGSGLTGVTPGANSVGAGQVIDGALTNADISVTAAIAGTKISPDFGGQNIVTIGNISGNGNGLTNLTATALNGVVSLVNGGTGSNNAAAARTNLGLGPLATLGGIGSTEVTDGSIINVDIGASAAISGTKITPNFGAQNIVTTGSVTAGTFIGDGSALTNLPGLALPFTGSSAVAGNSFSVTNSATSGSAANFAITGSNTSPVVNVTSNTNGDGINIQQNGINRALNITSAASSSSPSIQISNAGIGSSITVNQTNAGAAPVLAITNTGTGNAITSNRPIQATQFIGDGSLLTNLPATSPFTTANSIPRGDGSALVASAIQDDGTNSGVGSAPLSNSRLRVSQTTAASSTFGISVIASGASFSPTGIQATANGGSFAYGLSGQASSGSTESVGVSGSAVAAGSPVLRGVQGTGNGSAGQTTYGVTGSGNSGTTNYGIYGSAIGGATNWAGYFAQGNVAIENSLAVGGGNNFGTPGQVLTSGGPGVAPTWTTSGGFSLPFSSTQAGATPLFQISNSSDGGAASFQTTGTGGNAGYFHNLNPFNDSAAVGVASEGSLSLSVSGPSMLSVSNSGQTTLDVGNQFGGRAASFNSGGGSSPTIYVYNDGTGPGIQSQSPIDLASNSVTSSALSITTATNSVPAININQSGTGNGIVSNRGIFVNNISTSGDAGSFQVNNSSNNNTALSVSSNGIASAFAAIALGSSVANSAGQFEILNTSNGATALRTATNGTGTALVAINSGNGGGATVQVTNSTNGNPGIQVTHAGEGSGINVVQNKLGGFGPAISAASTGNGPTLSIQQTNNGRSLEFSSGGLRFNVADITAAGAIAARTTVYNVTVPGTFSLSWTALAGDAIYVWNNNASPITFAGQTINASTLARLIFVGGAWRVNQ